MASRLAGAAVIATCIDESSANISAAAEDELRRELRDWQSLHAMSEQLLETPLLADQLALLLRTVLNMHGSTQGAVSLFDEAQAALVPYASVGLSEVALSCIAKVSVGDGACGKAFQTQGRVIVQNTETDQIYEQYREFSRNNGIRAVCSTPFSDAGGKALGVLSVYLPSPRAPTDRELRLTDVCVGHAALLVGRAEMESKLTIERIRSQQILETMSEGFLVMDRQFRVVQINAEAIKIDGRAANEFIGRTHWDLWPGSESLPVGAHYKAAMESRIAVHFDQMYTHNGEDRWFEISAYPYATGLAVLYSDVTDSKASERAVQESNNRFVQLANTIPQLAWVADASGSIEWYNERWYAYTGTHFDQMQGWGWQSVHHPDTLDEVTTRWKLSIRTGATFQMTFPLRGKDGVYRPFLTLVSPLKDAENKVVQWFGTNTDVSAIEEAQSAVVKTEGRLTAGLKAGRMAVWDWDLSTNSVSSSGNAMELFGHDFSDLEIFWRTVDPEDIGRLRDAANRAIETGTSFHEEVRLVRPDNRAAMSVEVRGEVVCDRAGVSKLVQGITVDVSERAEAQKRLTEADRRKDEFLAMLAHELRNPLSPISSAAHLLTMGNVSPKLVKRSSEVILRQVGFMTDLIDDLLDVSRVTRGLVEINRDTLRVTDFLNSAIEQVRPLLDSRLQQLVVELEPGLPVICGDQTRLVQVLANLINNSAKYTPRSGKIQITVARAVESVSIRVIDNGMGISADLLPYVFDLFAQGERTPDRSQGGLGLGLALVKSIVELHGGYVRASSAGLGEGTTIEVLLPGFSAGNLANILPQDAGNGPAVAPLRITLVDDNVDAVLALASVLCAKGHITLVHHDAIALLETMDNEPPQDVFILDIGLPSIDGYELARRLRTAAASRSSKIIALTGYGQSHDRAIGKAAGFDEYFVKPMDIVRLDAILAAVVPRS